ncbi:hypothetical protein VFPBJ_03148 [Purpureocillium lilacinum]|uniref:Uncharacterized protein n=1 Tax=Purpureocillium lilacinum TaxID=33203 RepID=A0A179H454_PURLI|nr:hypothetical protein VFPBJ_03148 [Purpureocillium lilacinum]
MRSSGRLSSSDSSLAMSIPSRVAATRWAAVICLSSFSTRRSLLIRSLYAAGSMSSTSLAALAAGCPSPDSSARLLFSASRPMPPRLSFTVTLMGSVMPEGLPCPDCLPSPPPVNPILAIMASPLLCCVRGASNKDVDKAFSRACSASFASCAFDFMKPRSRASRLSRAARCKEVSFWIGSWMTMVM